MPTLYLVMIQTTVPAVLQEICKVGASNRTCSSYFSPGVPGWMFWEEGEGRIWVHQGINIEVTGWDLKLAVTWTSQRYSPGPVREASSSFFFIKNTSFSWQKPCVAAFLTNQPTAHPYLDDPDERDVVIQNIWPILTFSLIFKQLICGPGAKTGCDCHWE